MSDLCDSVIAGVRARGLTRRDEPFRLSSGEFSHDFVDAKRALARGADLKAACVALVELAAGHGADFDAVGGMTLGADAFAHGIAVLADKHWFVVRKQAKGHGTGRRIEGATLGEGTRVLLLDDAATTGGSILDALRVVRDTGATVTLAAALVDRGEVAAGRFAREGVPYAALMTYRDLGIDPVRGG